MEAMKKIVEVERQANSLVTEARVYKTMLLNQTKKRAEEEASNVLAKAEAAAAQRKEETDLKTAEISEKLTSDLKQMAHDIEKQVADKKTKLIEQLIKEVSDSDRSR